MSSNETTAVVANAADDLPGPTEAASTETPVSKAPAKKDANISNSIPSSSGEEDSDDGENSTTSTSSSTSNNNSNGDNNDTTKTESTKIETDPINLIAQAVAQKDEGNGHFKSGNLSLAARSYRKGTSLLKDLNHGNSGDDQVKSLLLSLQTNLSMVCYKQNKHQQSRDVASKALDVDGTSVKALYRRAVAHRKLADFDAARKDLREALKHDATNRDVQRELISIKKELERVKSRQKIGLAKAFSSKGSSFLYDDKEEEERKKLEAKKAENVAKKEAQKKRKLEWEEECVQRMSRGEEAIAFKDWDTERKKKEAEQEKATNKIKEEEERKRAEHRAMQKSKQASSAVDSSDSDDDELGDVQRGYKKTSDGRTTSYFTREQTEEDKKLQGSIVPQRLDTVGKTSGDGEGSGASAWNVAGTWEERNTSDWCSTSLTTFLEQVSVQTDGYNGLVKEVKNLTGEASVAFVSGKKCYVFDYHASLCYKIINSEKEVLASGDLKLPDISSTTITDELEVEILRWDVSPNAECVDQVTKLREELVNQVRSQVLLFVKAFNSQY